MFGFAVAVTDTGQAPLFPVVSTLPPVPAATDTEHWGGVKVALTDFVRALAVAVTVIVRLVELESPDQPLNV